MSQTLSEYLVEYVSNNRLQRFDDVLNHRTRHLTVVLENIFQAYNASACLRTCDCFGIQDVHVIESVNHFSPNPDIAKGASQWLSIHRYTDTDEEEASQKSNAATAECFRELRATGYRILATSPRQDSIPLTEIAIDQKTAVVFGAEKPGVSDFAIEEADELIHIPMFGFTESFNISVSAALILQQMTAQLHEMSNDWHLTGLEKQDIRELWVRQSLGPRLAPLIRRYEHEQQRAD